MSTARASRVVVSLNLLACVGAVLADGGIFIRQATRADILQPTQKVYIRWDGSQEKLLIQTKYEGPAEEMVWIVPVPSEPTVEMGDGAVFEEFSEETQWPDIVHADFAGLWRATYGLDVSFVLGGVAFGGSSPVQWRRRVGDYDVVLLRPVGEETVIDWLSANGYGVPDETIPILEDYIREQWWMVAAKIHPDALTDITREKLAQGLLHPLEMTFVSSVCLYPLRLTSIAAGPVEELIYIEGPTHYEPLTFAGDKWTIDVFGGPVHRVPQYHYLSDVELTIESLEGRTRTGPARHLTKLRRVFLPEEMTQDIIFTKLDYAKWLRSEDPLWVGEAATQYGRHRDPNGVVSLLDLLSSGILEQAEPAQYQYQEWPSPRARILRGDSDGFWHWLSYRGMRLPDGYERRLPYAEHILSVIWAIGEISVEHELSREAEDMLLHCTRHNNQLIRMEAYIALTKLRSERLGPILTERLAHLPLHGPSPASQNSDLAMLAFEMDIVADWISRFGAVEEKDVLAKALVGSITNLQGTTCDTSFGPQRAAPTKSDWFEWIVWRAACARDTRLIVPLQDLHVHLALTDGANPVLSFIQRAQASCGSANAIEAIVRQIDLDEAKFLIDGQVPTSEGMASLRSFYLWHFYEGVPDNLRVQVLRKHWLRYELYPMPADISDALLRLTLSERELSDWYSLYLLAGIKEHRSGDRDKLMEIWDRSDRWIRLIVTDVLYAWNDWQTLMSLYDVAESDEVQSEIAWALADLGIPQAVTMVEEQILGSWNPDWIASGRTFILEERQDIDIRDPNMIDALRKAETTWKYFHPQWGQGYFHREWQGLDDRRLAALKRLAGNSTIHPGVRFELLEIDYAAKDWAKPLLTDAIREVLEADPDSSTVAVVASGVDVQFVIDACHQPNLDEFRRTLLLNLLDSGSGFYMPVIYGLLREVWPQRYVETQGQSILFREPGNLATSLDYYSEHCAYRFYRAEAEGVLQRLIESNSLPAGYRAFLLVHWPKAPSRISIEFVDALLQEDMPDFIREALQQRLLKWQ